VVFGCAGALAAALLGFAAGCSSSSNAAASHAEAGPGGAGGGGGPGGAAGLPTGDAGGTDGGDGGVSLTWRAVLYNPSNFAAPLPDDGGTDAADDGGEDGGDAGDAGDGGDGGAPGVPGAQVCVYAQDAAIPPPSSPPTSTNCVTTAADGKFTIPSVPIRTNLALTVTKTGFIPGMLSVATASTPMTGGQAFPMFPLSYETNPVPPVAVDWQNKGQINAIIVHLAPNAARFEGDPGVTVSMSPMSGNGPIYRDMAQNYVPSAMAFVDDSAGYFNVDPGTYTLTFAKPSDPTTDCEPVLTPFGEFGFPVTTPAHSTQVLVAAGYWSGIVAVLCTQKPAIVSVDGG